MAKQQRILFQPDTYKSIQRGINQLANAIRPTLGPLPRVVAIRNRTRTKMPELVDNGHTIAQRTERLANPYEDLGAMFMRQALSRLNEQAGDGTATAAILLQSIYNQGVRYLAAGGNANQLRHYLEEGRQLILSQLDTMSFKVEGKAKLQQVAESLCHDPPLAKYLGEIFDIIGEHGQLQIRVDPGRGLEREYVEGMHWRRGLVSRELISNHAQLRADLEHAAVLVSDLELVNPDDLAPVLAEIVEAGFKSLLLISHKISEGTLALLLMNNKPGKFQVIAVKPPGLGAEDQVTALEDMAILTGARPLLQAAGNSLAGFRLDDIGKTRRAWANLGNFGIVGGQGDARVLRQHIAGLRALFDKTDDPDRRRELRLRIGKLLGGSATLLVGGSNQPGIAFRKQLAERAADALRGAMREGVLPGAGMALLASRSPLEKKLAQSSNTDERAAYAILLKAVQEPARAIMANAGHEPAKVLAQLEQAKSGYGLDVRCGRIVSLAEAGILDPAPAQKFAVYQAITTAALALTVDVMVTNNYRDENSDSTPTFDLNNVS